MMQQHPHNCSHALAYILNEMVQLFDFMKPSIDGRVE